MKRFLLYLLLSILFFGCVRSRFFNNQEYERLDIIYIKNIPLVKVSINGKLAYFLLDTGCSLSNIDSCNIEYFNYQIRDLHDDGAYVSGMTGVTAKYYGTRHCSLTIGKIEIQQELACFNQNCDYVISDMGLIYPMHGLIGSDLISRYGIIVDLEDRAIYIKKQL